MATEGKGPIVIPCYLVSGVPYVLEVDANGKLAVRAAEIETLLAGGLPAALDTGALQVKEQSPLSGFATSANQATMITALQLIDDLRNALLTVATDRLGVRATELETLLAGGLPSALATDALKVREQGTVTVQAGGGDKLLSLESTVHSTTTDPNLPAGPFNLESAAVPTGKLWVITHVSWKYFGTPPTYNILRLHQNGNYHPVKDWRNITSNLFYDYPCRFFLPAGATMAMYFGDCTLNDDAELVVCGYQMDAP